MKTILAVVALLILTGCADRVSGWRIAQLHEQCNTRGGMHSVRSFMGYADAVCVDGYRVYADRPTK